MRRPLLPWLAAAGAVLAALMALAALAGCSTARPAPGPAGRHVAPVGSTSAASSSSRGGGWDGPAQATGATRPDVLARQMQRELTTRRRADPCRHNRAAKFVRVSIRRQHLWMCARHRLVRDTPITSGVVGRYTSTPTGRYTIQGRERDTTLTLITGQQYVVKYWIPFDAPLFGFHDASWQTFPYGSPKYRRHGSHGCVHMPLRAIAFLYRWADVGTPVRITA